MALPTATTPTLHCTLCSAKIWAEPGDPAACVDCIGKYVESGDYEEEQLLNNIPS